VTSTNLRRTTFWSILRNLLLAVSIVTLAVVVELNSLILAHPEEWLCLSCLLTVYSIPIGFITLWLCLSEYLWDGKLYAYSLYTFTMLALVFFFCTVQITTIPKAWVTPYVLACALWLLVLVYLFSRIGKQAAQAFLMFALVLTLYESANLVRIVSKETVLSSLGSRSAEVPPQKRPGTNLPHVFVLVFDELSLVHVLKDESLNQGVVPNLGEFAREAIWYRKAVTPYAFTEYAVPALLTGRKDLGTFQEVFLKQTTNDHLFSVAAATHDVYISGYFSPYCEAFRPYVRGCRSLLQFGVSSTEALLRSWWLRAVPGEVRYLGLVYRLKDFLSGGFDPPKTLTEALQLGQDFSVPTFTYIHVGLPHDPYMFRSHGEIRLGVVGMAFRLKSMTQRQLDEVKNWYLEQVAYTDQLLGMFLAQLKELNLYEQSLIIVTSDHGVSFDQAHPWRSQQWIDVEEIGRVPFLVKMPGQHTGWIDDRQILNIELHKIILTVLEEEQ
jgi:hypothetical protein